MNDKEVLGEVFKALDQGVGVGYDDSDGECFIERVDMPDDEVIIELSDGSQYVVTLRQVRQATHNTNTDINTDKNTDKNTDDSCVKCGFKDCPRAKPGP
jgi:hypothetical protein